MDSRQERRGDPEWSELAVRVGVPDAEHQQEPVVAPGDAPETEEAHRGTGDEQAFDAGRFAGDVDQAERDCIDLIDRFHGQGRLSFAVTVRFAPTSTPAQLAMAGRLLAEVPGLYMQTHVAENRAEVAWVAELFPEARSYLDVYHRAGLLNERAVLAHGIWLDERSDLELSQLDDGQTLLQLDRGDVALRLRSPENVAETRLRPREGTAQPEREGLYRVEQLDRGSKVYVWQGRMRFEWARGASPVSMGTGEQVELWWPDGPRAERGPLYSDGFGDWVLAESREEGDRPVARYVSPELSERLKQPVVVETRAGATGTIGADIVAKAPPDGYSLLLGYISEIERGQKEASSELLASLWGGCGDAGRRHRSGRSFHLCVG